MLPSGTSAGEAPSPSTLKPPELQNMPPSMLMSLFTTLFVYPPKFPDVETMTLLVAIIPNKSIGSPFTSSDAGFII